MTTPLTIYLVVTPGVLLLDYAGPAEALRMAREMGAALAMHTCGPCSGVNTSLGTQLAGIEPLPQRLPPNSLVLITGNSTEQEDYATPAAQQLDCHASLTMTGTRIMAMTSPRHVKAQPEPATIYSWPHRPARQASDWCLAVAPFGDG